MEKYTLRTTEDGRYFFYIDTYKGFTIEKVRLGNSIYAPHFQGQKDNAVIVSADVKSLKSKIRNYYTHGL